MTGGPDRASRNRSDRQPGSDHQPTRRRFLAGVSVAIAGVTLPLASLWHGAAADEAAADEPDATDRSLAQFAESLELAATAAYDTAAKTGKLTTPTTVQAAELFAAHHKAHAASFGTYAGDAAKGVANPRLAATLTSLLQGATDEPAIVRVCYGMENALAATYLNAVGALADPTALKAVAAILPVESQHATAFGHVLGEGLGDQGTYIPAFLTTDAAVSPTDYPISPGT